MKCQVCSTPLQYESCIDYEYPEEATGEEHTPDRCASTRLTSAEREAAARARAVEEAAGICDEHARESDSVSERDAAHARFLSERIRALTPDPALVVVRREDLRHAVEACGCAASFGPLNGWWEYSVRPDGHCAAVDRVAALARMGESDG